jgi:predicted pyridoxine 5'-phosphate oxidase superfamily flavin-nucleotide-binding protein
MGHSYANIAFTPNVKALQERQGSRRAYARNETGAPHHDTLGPAEADFIAARDSFYIASVSETGWPYVQHRGGAAGFLRVLDRNTLGFADYRGNRQYISTGNIGAEDRVSLFLMDYPNRARLKIFGRASIVGVDDTETLARLDTPEYGAGIERGIIIAVEAFDWNCSQHITPRFTIAEVETYAAPLHAEIEQLRAKLAALQGGGAA